MFATAVREPETVMAAVEDSFGRGPQLIRLRLGLEDGRYWTQGEIAWHWGVTTERIVQLENRCVRTLEYLGRLWRRFDSEPNDEPDPAEDEPSDSTLRWLSAELTLFGRRREGAEREALTELYRVKPLGWWIRFRFNKQSGQWDGLVDDSEVHRLNTRRWIASGPTLSRRNRSSSGSPRRATGVLHRGARTI